MILRVRFGGAGGHGIALAGLILAEAAAAAGRRVVCTQAHGPESRGGASRSDVIISDRRVAFPVARRLDVLAALTQEAWERSKSALVPDGLAIVDAGRVAPGAGDPPVRCAAPIIETARAITGTALAANMVVLGLLGELTAAVPAELLEDAAARRVPAASRSLNLAAFHAGRRLAAAVEPVQSRLGGTSEAGRSGSRRRPAPASRRAAGGVP